MSRPPTVLLQIKKLREQTAVRHLNEARAALAQAQERLAAKRQELADYRAERPKLERRLYDDILRREVSLTDLEELNAKVVRLREHEEGLVENEIELERAAEAAAEAERDARLAWRAAGREVEKVDELLADWQRGERQRLERLAELELEEFSRPSGVVGR